VLEALQIMEEALEIFVVEKIVLGFEEAATATEVVIVLLMVEEMSIDLFDLMY
jgi:hypothetical protein